MDIGELDLGRAGGVLKRNGIETTDDLVELNPRELLALPGLGSKSVSLIVETVEELGLSLAADPWSPYVCVRHAGSAWDVGLADLFLCDACAHEFRFGAFGEEAPAWESEPTGGYCLNCNMSKENVRLRQWFLCAICERVARSIGRSVVAGRYLMERCNTEVSEHVSDLRLVETDPPVLRPRNAGQMAERVAAADFTALAVDSDSPVFGIELKTGRSYVRVSLATRIEPPRCHDLGTTV